MSFRASELLLIVFLVVIVGLTRVYYGAPQGPMFVWKGEFSYKDTVVDLPKLLAMPRPIAILEHPKLIYQLEEMGLIDEDEQFKFRKSKVRLSGARTGAQFTEKAMYSSEGHARLTPQAALTGEINSSSLPKHVDDPGK